jgi:MFS family permease
VNASTAIRQDGVYPKPAYAWYVASILMLANLCCYTARISLFLLVQPINHDLHLSDTQMSLLQGAAFSIFFVIAGLPVGWLADRSGRRNIVIASVVIWSLMSMFCGLASSYEELFLARVGVGIGEAALMPAAISLVADYFPPHRRGRAMALYYIGTPVGSGVATMIGGVILRWLEAGGRLPYLGTLAPWQVMFVLAGAPGFLVAIVLLTVREPARHDLGSASSESRAIDKFGAVGFMANRWRAFLPVCLSLCLMQFCAYAVGAWAIPLLVRRDHLTTPEAGGIHGLLVMVVGLLAACFGGVLGDRLGSMRAGGRFRAIFYAFVIFIPGVLMLSLASTPGLASIGLAIQFFGVCAGASVMYAVLQDIVPNQYRGQAAAILSMLVTLGSATLGPTAVALITDHLFHNPTMVGYSILLATLPSAAMGVVLTVQGLKSYTHARDMLSCGTHPLVPRPVPQAKTAVPHA